MSSKGILNATIWSSIQRFGGLTISFVSNMVLARLLCPDDFGTLALIMVFVGIADVLVDGGLGNALVQKRDLTTKDSTTVFTANLAFSGLLFVLLFFIAPFIEKFTGVNNFSIYLRVQSICVLIRAFYVVNVSHVSRNLNFKNMAWVTLLSQSIATTVAIVMAYKGLGVWSLVLKTILLDLICCILYAVVSPFKYRLSFDLTAFKSLFAFGLPVAIANILEAIYSNIVSFIIGKKYSITDLGYYNQAYSLEQIPVYSVSAIVNQVFFPFFSRMQDDKDSLRNNFKNTVSIVTFVVYPILSFLIFFAEPVITIIYSEKWVPCVPIFQVLCLSGFFNSLYHLSRSTLKAIGKSNVLLYTQIASVIIGLLAVLLFVRFKMMLFVWVIVFNSFISYLIVGFCVGKFINFSLFNQIKTIAYNFLLSMILGFALCKLYSLINISLLLGTLFFFVLYVFVFYSISYLLHTHSNNLVLSFYKSKKHAAK